MNGEDELANVLAHEIVHAEAGHGLAQQEVVERENPLIVGIVHRLRLAAYKREQERAADLGGQELAARTGYDPTGMARFLRQLRDAEVLSYWRPVIPSFFGTHPGTAERVAEASARATRMAWQRDPSIRAGRAEYLRRVDTCSPRKRGRCAAARRE